MTEIKEKNRLQKKGENDSNPEGNIDIDFDFQSAIEMLKTGVSSLKGVGPKRAQSLKRGGVEGVEDLLYLFPRYYIDLRRLKGIRELTPGEDAALVVEVVSARQRFTSRAGYRRIYEAVVTDGRDRMTLVWFNAPYMKGRLKVGEKLLVRGVVSRYKIAKRMAHPDIEGWAEGNKYQGEVIPRYPLPEGVKAMTMVKVVREAVQRYAHYLPDGVPEDVRKRLGLLDLSDAISRLHIPDETEDAPDTNDGSWLPVRSIAMDELFIMEMGLLLKREEVIRSKGRSFGTSGRLMEEFVSRLPFTMTPSQERVLGEIATDMRSDFRTHRLLQGDVGSGKTVVAVASALLAVERGAQSAIMAPTEILAGQHYKNLVLELKDIGVTSALLTASVKGKEREGILEGIRDGSIDILFGTHALIQEGVEFSDLGFVVVDEQHRFGVLQRGAIISKGEKEGKGLKRPEVLVMSATPIPRTLALTLYGDLDVSTIDELPPGRRPVVTHLFGDGERAKAYDIVRDELNKGRQAYMVYPLVEESEVLGLKDATRMAESLKGEFRGFKVGLITGRMKGDEKDGIMAGFSAGEIDILVATTVVEVGMDVPNATVMVVEEAQRYGLSQLHQLRGRVGRGSERSYCILISDSKVSEGAKKRLEVITKTTDGFAIAEEDLKIRGPGEFLGTKQSGIPEFRAADLLRDVDTLLLARREAIALIRRDPTLEEPAHRTTRAVLIHRFRGRLKLLDIG